jgi:hypothetical protein
VADADAVIQSVFEALEKDEHCASAVDALHALYEGDGWGSEKIVAAVREGLDEAEGD